MRDDFPSKQMNTDKLYQLFEQYNKFVMAKGIVRIKAIEWAADQIQYVKPLLKDFVSEEILLQNIGWTTFTSFGLYSGIVRVLEATGSSQLDQTRRELIQLLNDVIAFTNIGHFLSLGISLETSDELSYAQIDQSGNIFIFPSDTQKLLTYLEEQSDGEW